MHIYRWDLDKTYLDTEIGSVRGLLRAALQTASEKQNVPGSATLLRSLVAHDPSARVFILSGSPTQMRAVLEEKLALDGVPFDDLILKDNLGNLRRGRLRALRDQLGYKLPQLLEARAALTEPCTESLFGDDSEVDALIYAAYAAVVRGDMDTTALGALLEAGSVYPDAAQRAVDAAQKIPPFDAVQEIFIHVDKGVPLRRFDLLGDSIIPVFSWLQAALVLHNRGRLRDTHLFQVMHDCVSEASLRPNQVAGLLQDAVRRGLIHRAPLKQLLRHPEFRSISQASIRAIDRLGPVQPPAHSAHTQFLEFLKIS